MELENVLLEAIKDRFIANSTIRAIEVKIEKIAKENTLLKYKDKILIADDLEFELYDVRAKISIPCDSLELEKVNLSLFYFCKSKLPKVKREKIESMKSYYDKRKQLLYNYSCKVQLWRALYYEIDIKQILSGDYNLRLDLTKDN